MRSTKNFFSLNFHLSRNCYYYIRTILNIIIKTKTIEISIRFIWVINNLSSSINKILTCSCFSFNIKFSSTSFSFYNIRYSFEIIGCCFIYKLFKCSNSKASFTRLTTNSIIINHLLKVIITSYFTWINIVIIISTPYSIFITFKSIKRSKNTISIFKRPYFIKNSIVTIFKSNIAIKTITIRLSNTILYSSFFITWSNKYHILMTLIKFIHITMFLNSSSINLRKIRMTSNKVLKISIIKIHKNSTSPFVYIRNNISSSVRTIVYK